MNEAIALPPGVAFAIIAFLLSLLPAGLFIWLWYLRRVDRPVPVNVVTISFVTGIALVWPAFKLEEAASRYWYSVSPSTAHYFMGAVLPLQKITDILLPALGTFIVVATVEEGLRYLVLRLWFRKGKDIDQVFDGLVLGIAIGLGFATLENTLYFLNLFSSGSFDTLVFVFFLRFLISTLAHISFAGLMGAMIARGVFAIYKPQKRRWFLLAFLVPWFLHGLYDLLLGLDLTIYAVLILLPPLLVLINWMNRRDFFAIARVDGKILVNQVAPETHSMVVMRKYFKQSESPWNVNAKWLRERRLRYNILKDLENE
jgi:RsiW-degrading membrane proteinase PrsW (M82 family)